MADQGKTSALYCYLIIYSVGSAPKKLLSKFYYDFAIAKDKKRIGSTVIYKTRKGKVVKVNFLNRADAKSFILYDLKYRVENVTVGLARKARGVVEFVQDNKNLNDLESFESKLSSSPNEITKFSNYKDLFDYAGDKVASRSLGETLINIQTSDDSDNDLDFA